MTIITVNSKNNEHVYIDENDVKESNKDLFYLSERTILLSFLVAISSIDHGIKSGVSPRIM